MKVIKYNLATQVNCGTAENPNYITTLSEVEMGWNEINEEIAKNEAYNGEYTIEDDGQPEPDTASTDDVLNAMLGVM